jgi:hypothetical protein
MVFLSCIYADVDSEWVTLSLMYRCSAFTIVLTLWDVRTVYTTMAERHTT